MTDTPGDPFKHLRNPTEYEKWRAKCEARAGRLSGYRKRAKPLPHDPVTFLKQGAMYDLEYRAAARAAAEAIRHEQRYWYPIIKRWLADPDLDPMLRGLLERELKRLRRVLGIRQTAKEKRAKTRERVRQYRLRNAA